MHDAFALCDTAAARPVHADRVHLVHVGHRAIALGEIADLRKRRDIAIHRIQAFAGDQLRTVGIGGAKQLFEMRDVVVTEHDPLTTRLADAFDHRIVVERVGQDQAVRNELCEGRNAGLVRDVAGREQQRRRLAVQIGKFLLELDQRMVGAGDIAGAAGAGADAGRGLDHGADHLRMLTHAEVVVGTPDHDVARSLRRVPGGVGKPAGDALEVGENAIAPLVMKAIERGTEELAIIHDKIRKIARDAGPIRALFRAFPARLSSRNSSIRPRGDQKLLVNLL